VKHKAAMVPIDRCRNYQKCFISSLELLGYGIGIGYMSRIVGGRRKSKKSIPINVDMKTYLYSAPPPCVEDTVGTTYLDLL
jgi:hypothetical protein